MTPERWLEVRVRSAEVSPEVLVEGLLELGGRAVWEEGEWQVTHIPDPGGPQDRESWTTGLLRRLRRHLTGAVETETRWQAHEDWSELWKQGLDARRISPRLLVSPSWVEARPEGEERLLVLDPGMAFGTAEHGTTRGCLRLLDHVIQTGDRVLDVGSGSGILGIAAALLGADEVEGLEMDEWAVDAAAENVVRNQVSDRVAVRCVQVTPRLLADRGSWDGVVANMETGRLRPLLAGLLGAARPGGWVILSGILDHEFSGVRGEMEALGAVCERVDRDGEWRSALFRPGGDPDR